jgi:hypothetical protein
MDSTDRETRPAGRSMVVTVFGDTADEIELAALDEARPFFGDRVQLEVVRNWEAEQVRPAGSLALQAAGKKYCAGVTVRTIGPEGGQ